MGFGLAERADSHEILHRELAYLGPHPFRRVPSQAGRGARLVVEHFLDVAHDRHHCAAYGGGPVKSKAAVRTIKASLDGKSVCRPATALDFCPPAPKVKSFRE